jgi:SAM-dependent methyltransferase
MNEEQRPRAATVGLRDRQYEGWLNGETGELAPGVRVRSCDTVIDVGCGDGGFIGFCARQGAETIFIDLDEQRLRVTEERIKTSPARAYRAIQSDCDPIPLADDTGDIVICTEVLEHVADPEQFLGELIRITRPGSKLVITVPDSRSEQFVGATAPPQYFQHPNHIRIFSSQEFKELICEAGLSIVSHQYMGCFWSMYWPLSWLTAEPGSAGLPIDNQHPITDHWTRLWQEVQKHPNGHKIRGALNSLLPKSQSIVATKPL